MQTHGRTALTVMARVRAIPDPLKCRAFTSTTLIGNDMEWNLKAPIYYHPGPPAVLRYEDVPDPEPGEGEILVRIEAISIEVGDLVSRARTSPQNPSVPLAYAASGEVVGLEPHAAGFGVGDKVATFAFLGSHAELRTVSTKA